jgi:hypothetical protein
MSLEFEQLTTAVADMAHEATRRRQQQQVELDKALSLLREYAEAWPLMDERLDRAIDQADIKFYRSARPLHHELPLDRGIAPQPPLNRATIIAADGSQIVPDRHAPFLYYLINVGVITYHHGSGRPPQVATFPTLIYPQETESDEDDAFSLNSNLVSMRRDLAEITTLARIIKETSGEPGPTLGIVDQRLLYWPIGNASRVESDRIALQWQTRMSEIRAMGGWLTGFIDRPGKRSVLTMLHTLDLADSGRKVSDLYRGDSHPAAGLTDTHLFDALLKPEERSVVFIDISEHNKKFSERDADNEVCFFYLKTGPGEGQLARVDLPIWLASQKEALNEVHALLVDQCRIMGSYPYVITRADEIAVVGRRDQEELENRIALRLAELNIHTAPTSKQTAKDIARGGKTRHEG